MGVQKDNGKEFYLLNKNKLLARFHVEGTGVLEIIKIDKQFETVPEWIGDLRAFIGNRRAPKKRENIARLLEMSGCDTIYGCIN